MILLLVAGRVGLFCLNYIQLPRNLFPPLVAVLVVDLIEGVVDDVQWVADQHRERRCQFLAGAVSRQPVDGVQGM